MGRPRDARPAHLLSHRAAEIRTRGLSDPNGARYQTAPQPVTGTDTTESAARGNHELHERRRQVVGRPRPDALTGTGRGHVHTDAEHPPARYRLRMRIVPSSAPGATSSTPAPAPVELPAAGSAWTNPAASAALRSTADLLKGIEDGVVRNFKSVELVRGYAADLKSTIDIMGTDATAISTDGSQENDSFLPLISTAGGGVEHAESRLSAKDLTATWQIERGDILAAIRLARAISQNVADQLDPRSVRESR